MKTGAKEIVFPSECRLLQGLTPEEYRDLCGCMKARELHLRNKQTFVIETDPCDRIGIVVSGAVQLSRTRIDGGRNVLETVLPNDTFGTTYVFRDVKNIGISMSAVGETVVVLFDITNIAHPHHNGCPAHMQFVQNLLTIMSQKTFQIKQKLRIISPRTIRERLMTFLNIYAKRMKSNEFDIPFDRQALADYLCVERSALSAEISKLRNEGVLESDKKHFRLIL